ncbi:putative P-loop-containing kinase [Wenxinia marina DSM 24838]|uniref:Putative P-loop-containing kinase n=1 Tax=Wenxinia marina DSM 24838 TaxID=1123501 RepID=A0A0D0QE28_9RHOB|nr:putative P-loop-containing kinase [Wenxinia marina DSM 24838]
MQTNIETLNATNPDGRIPVAPDGRQRVVLVTGPSGAGRSTAINALEDLGWEVIDNLPLSLLPRLIDGPPLARPLALGLDVRNRDFGVDALIEAIDRLAARDDVAEQVLYLDAPVDDLVARYSETRRRHPLAPEGPPLKGIEREKELLVPIRGRADILIETGGLTPHDLRAEMFDLFAGGAGRTLAVSIQSFSYKRGLPRGADLVFDVRFLRNPHWEPSLRGRDGRDPAVLAHVEADPRYDEFFARTRDLLLTVLPGYRDEGKSHLVVAFGCTGGQHRSVAIAREMASALAAAGWQVSSRHRELERRAALADGGPERGTDR